ncbi:MAG: hypothetical protein AB7V13_03245 [Pseudorhodoplanes sp.]|uniref:hypothetical protein n=1 Tax=Pseudorhodoplanes sp. TaxID=1934341 RepID=UPI003D14E337
MQIAIEELRRLGPLPESTKADPAQLEEVQNLLAEVATPVSDDDAKILVSLFGPDDCYGLAWTLLHLVDTAPGWPIEECLTDFENEWILRLKRRVIARSS